MFSVFCLFVIRGGGASFSVSIELVPSAFFEELEGRSVRCIFEIREGGANCSVSIELVPLPFLEEAEGMLFDCFIALLPFFEIWVDLSVSIESESEDDWSIKNEEGDSLALAVVAAFIALANLAIFLSKALLIGGKGLSSIGVDRCLHCSSRLESR